MKIWFTITGTNHYQGQDFFEKGQKVILEKEILALALSRTSCDNPMDPPMMKIRWLYPCTCSLLRQEEKDTES